MRLALNTEDMLAGLKRWVECESPTYDKPAVDRMMALAGEDIVAMGAEAERIDGPSGLGDCVRASFPHSRQGEPGILVMAHLDTVHPLGTLDELPFRREDSRCYGPGILDMKGGTYAALRGIESLRNSGFETPLPVHVLLTSDEEIGSPGTRELIEAEANKHRFILVPEPAFQHRGVVTGRYAIARFHLTAKGRPSHAGKALKKGRSAVHEMARQILAIESMTDDDCTFSVGVVHGGQWVNCVPTRCTAEVLSMAKRQENLDRGIDRLKNLSHSEADGTSFIVEKNVVRPIWEPSAKTMQIYENARRIAGQLGRDLIHGSSGGGSDANFTGALGLPTLDGLGLEGDGAHTLGEYIEIESLPLRGRLMAGLVAELGS